MQATLVSPRENWPGFSMDYDKISSKMTDDFKEKLKFEEELRREEVITEEKAGNDLREEEEGQEVEIEVEEEEEEFSFAITNPDGSPISADDLFQDGQIRPIFPIFDRSLLFSDGEDGASAADESSLRLPLKKLFIEERERSSSSSSSSEADELEALPPGTYCEWSRKAVEASPEMNKKSNSTGFSKLWRFRDLVVRSSSDGKDAFVFLNPNSTNPTKQNVESIKKMAKAEKSVKATPSEKKVAASGEAAAVNAKLKVKAKRGQTASSAHERYYVRNKAKDDKRKSYLPYRPDLVGFFTNVNGLSRNVHPF
ncbi:uncharacterized protein LOC133822103 [Humulus lupulus]|uniref:uncharacterized protein LOC133822103 n=1 Tax=Humulus lupulus TaxID=3486 RepID=UPI002B40F86C|nr:uncharacterized protein LOC133822103 [Humulus lupulus]